jgi:hypothetical protein
LVYPFNQTATALSSRAKVVLAAVSVLASGCASLSSFETARTLGRGKVEFSLEPGVGGALADPALAHSGLAPWAPQGNVAVRGGVSDSVDLGGRVGTTGAEIQTRFALLPNGFSVVHLSLAPAVGYFPPIGGVRGFVFAQLPLLFGVETGGGSELVLGPKVLDISYPGAGRSSSLFAGASLGFRIQLARHFALHPEVAGAWNVLQSPSGEAVLLNATGQYSGAAAPLIVQAGLGFIFNN